MKKLIIAVCIAVALCLLADTAYYKWGFYISFDDSPVTTFTKTEEGVIKVNNGSSYEEFTVKGVNMGSGIPGQWSTDFDIDEATYYRWLGYMQEMGANTLRIYTVQNEHFYNAFYKYNSEREKQGKTPLFLIHGVWVNDYIQNSHRDAYDKNFCDAFLRDCRTMIDVIHGKKKISVGEMASAGSGSYKKDISKWVIGYILGVEWEDVTVVYTDMTYENTEGRNSYSGKYMYTSEEASPFESMLAMIGDKVIEYESDRYRQQRLIAFSNWPTTDPFTYPENVERFFMKCAYVDVEHIKTTENFLSGQFVSYHVYPYYPDYMDYVDNFAYYGITNLDEFINEDGTVNTYKMYLRVLTNYHSMPVVISEFGVSTGRGMAQKDRNTGRNQGKMSESGQGKAIIDCWEDIMSAGCNGGCVFTWQDEWFKRTWNTMYAVDLKRTPYWSDYQTNEQYFGLLSFDPGKEQSVCYVDGDVSEWGEEDIAVKDENSSLSVKYDEKFIYFLAYKKGMDFDEDTIYIPIDTTQRSGSTYCKSEDIKFERSCDFLLKINGKSDSRLLVQHRYEALRSTYADNILQINAYENKNIPDIDTPEFVTVNMILQTATALIYNDVTVPSDSYETGKLLYGNANPQSEDFNSLADFINNGDYIEIKLPWQLLNFSDPSRMMVHDDYYDGNYGVSYIHIDEMFVGLSDGTEGERIPLACVELDGWGNDVTYHERLKRSYYEIKDYWTSK